ncbi:hypothetical protein LH61_04745 [Leuconostoc mesenteroides P45]|uniref:DNA cytosine methyltransferase n=1 Tax=Leuconostoc mesenteroides TaxID=1245 RepID=UPI000501AE24|nr:DNA cytosine methyltransferase [Leuconostoc mesenteroides]KGB50808.1 hypothetical protein LH61_04745 [Leuconostoc mesenteroides P45]
MKKEFVSASTLSVEEIRSILLQKIDEQSVFLDTTEDKELLRNITPIIGKSNVVSLFSGAGGLDLGLELAGIDAVKGSTYTDNILKDKDQYDMHRSEGLFNFIYSNDVFKEANQTYTNNFPENVYKHEKDIREVSFFPENQIMVGGFPCPGFSVAGPRLLDDPRNFLYLHFIRALVDTQPEFFIAENVKGIMTLANGAVFKQVVEDFASAGYEMKAFLINSRDYGVPQIRERVLLVGTHIEKIKKNYDWEYKLPGPTHGTENGLKDFVTLKEAIGDLPKDPSDVFSGNFSPMYMSRNRKKRWDEQSFTIQASGRQAPLHPSGKPMKKIDSDHWELVGQNRRLSVREVARIQTFPNWFKFSDGGNLKAQKNHRLNQQYKQIGNAVPVKMARQVLRPIAEFLNEHSELAFRK